MDGQKSFFGTPKKAFIFIVCVLAVLFLFIIGTTAAITAIVASNKQAGDDKGSAAIEEEQIADDSRQVKGQEMPVIEDDTTVIEDDTTVVEDGVQMMEDDSSAYGSGLAGQPGAGTPDMEVEEAKNIAVSHAGFAVSDVSFSKTKLEKEHGMTVYEIEFYKDGMEYDYEINAETGEIIKSEVDRDD